MFSISLTAKSALGRFNPVAILSFSLDMHVSDSETVSLLTSRQC